MEEFMKMTMKGNAHKYGDNINTDVIIPSRYYWSSLLSEEGKNMAQQYTLADLDPDFVKKVKKGDVLVVGQNFACGSSRENAAAAFVLLEVSAIIAKSFAHIFFRNAVNNGLPVIISPEAYDKIESGDSIEIDVQNNKIKNLTKGIDIAMMPIHPKIAEILNNGGLVNLTKKRLNK
jgi:3-isopropylmalate/(R)-2-methylmalate dehydratase small subunit